MAMPKQPEIQLFLASLLEDARRRDGWSVKEAAQRLGVSVRTYRKLEAGERWPSEETWVRIVEAFPEGRGTFDDA
jgi:transcriptional regulator with XRE-family HTH domain